MKRKEDSILADLESAFAEGADEQAMNQGNELEMLRSAIHGAFWYKFKTLRNDYEKYNYYWSRVILQLHNGPTNYIKQDGAPMLDWKPVQEQLSILKNIVTSLKLTDEQLSKYARIDAERKERRALYSGAQADRDEFEGVRPRTTYAKTDNERAMDEFAAQKGVTILHR